MPGWVYVGVTLAGLAAHRAYVARRNPDLARRRSEGGPGTRGWDVAWLVLFWPLMISIPVTTAVAACRLVLAPLAAPSIAVGVLPYGSAMALSAAAMAANPAFEGSARIQPGQAVADTGPYRHVRHPGYAALALWAISGPFLLRSREALAPAAVTAAWVVARTVLEDRMLRAELHGYREYAARVRWRLVPGVW
jgi:protein-S-isoprenylcysteine O-methyltransferase Ste14